MSIDSSKAMQNHNMEMRNIVAQLKSLEVKIYDFFLLHFILNCLPIENGPFKILYSTHKKKWSVSKFLTMYGHERKIEIRNH